MSDESAKSRSSRLKTKALLFLCLFLASAGVFFGYLQDYASTPTGSSEEAKFVEIKPGMTLRQVAHFLNREQLLSSPGTFMVYTYAHGKQNDIRAGEYQFSPSMAPRKILDYLTQGQTILYTVTIPEGYRITEIAELFEKKGLADKAKFIQASKNSDLLAALKIPSGSLEGYLYPDTYKFSKDLDEEKIIKTLVDTFRDRVYKPDLIEQAKEVNLTFHQAITLASLIEKETGLGRERKLISSVFHNRLKQKMRLQTDPTVIYAISDFDGNIRKKDLSIDSPYNTYKYYGLPPGPIASPGLDSIMAALRPEKSKYLYFVSRKDGSHQFSTNYKDHTRAVEKYQLNRRIRG